MRLLLASAALAITAWHASPAWPHSWYSPSCCSGRDCAPIPVEAVGFDADGNYRVILRAGSHPMVTEDREFIAPREKVRASQDGHWHACITPGLTFLCLYEPGMF